MRVHGVHSCFAVEAIYEEEATGVPLSFWCHHRMPRTSTVAMEWGMVQLNHLTPDAGLREGLRKATLFAGKSFVLLVRTKYFRLAHQSPKSLL